MLLKLRVGGVKASYLLLTYECYDIVDGKTLLWFTLLLIFSFVGFFSDSFRLLKELG